MTSNEVLPAAVETAPVKPWQWIAALQDDPNVTASELRLIGIVRWADYETGGEIFPGDENIARAIRADVRTVKRIRKSLTAKGYLTLIKAGRGNARLAAVYQLSIPVQGDTGDTLGSQGDISRIAKVTSEACQGDISRSQGDTHVPPPIQGSIQSTDPTSPPAAPDDGDGDDEDEEAWADWWNDPDNGGAVAESLGVPLASIGRPFRAWFQDLDMDLEDDFLALHYAIEASAGKRNPVGYLKAVLPGYVSELRESGEAAFKAKYGRAA